MKMIHAFILFCLWFCHLIGMFSVETEAMKTVSVSVTEGDSVTLNSSATDIQGYNTLEWRFAGRRIARIKEVNGIFTTSWDDSRFINSLRLSNQTGSLNITNIQSEHSGVYELSISTERMELTVKSYNVTVHAPLPIPVISSYCTQKPPAKWLLVCSVVNVSHVTLSWLKGNSLLSSISVSDLSISLSLPLEVEDQEKNTYSCQISNPIRNQTTHLDISDCSWSSDSVCGCDTLEPVIRLVVTLLMGVAAVVAILVLMHDLRYRREEKIGNRQQRN